ncbi:hypothetical protein I4U23_015023 [Adineta vaga]|nr:hypothetical protein I4U23_015023 [Adineta vaga]
MMNKQVLNIPTRQIPHTRLIDDGSIETRYEILNKLGKGSFGIVYRVQNKSNHMFYAVKAISKKLGQKSKSISFDNEVKLLTEVNHPNLIHLHEVLESSQNLYLIIELCEGGELGGYVKTHGPLPEQTVKHIMSKLINALHYLHKIDVVHRDLKLENILLKKTPSGKTDIFDIRVTDFGLSSKKSITSTDSLFNDYCGTPLYMAPEILENKNYSALCDVWAMGVIMFYLICGRHPYVAHDERRLLEIIRSTTLRFDVEKFRNISSQGIDFLQGMLVYDTVHRRTMGELIVHPWLTGRSDKEPTKDIITMMKEFHAEDHQRQKTSEISLTELINATAEHPKSSATVVDDIRSQLNEMDSNRNTLEHEVNTTDQHKSNVKSSHKIKVSRRAPNVLHDMSTVSVNPHKLNLVDTYENRQANHPSSSMNVARLHPGNTRLSRSRSQVDRPNFTKLSVKPRTIVNDSNQILTSHSPVFKDRLMPTPTSSTITALMMINKPSSVPYRPQHQLNHTRKISLYDKRPREHI